MISQGTHPSTHPGVLRNIASFIGIQAPVPAEARRVSARLRFSVIQDLDFGTEPLGEKYYSSVGGDHRLTKNKMGIKAHG